MRRDLDYDIRLAKAPCERPVLPLEQQATRQQILSFKGQLSVSILSNIFILVYVVYAWSWHSPKDSFSKRMVDKASPFIMWLGLWHSWKMFAPRPTLVNHRLIIELVHANRRKTIVEETSFVGLSRWSAFLNSRERKYENNLAGSDFKFHWDALCRYAATHYRSKINSRVVRVNLLLATQRIGKLGDDTPKPFVSTRLWQCDLDA